LKEVGCAVCHGILSAHTYQNIKLCEGNSQVISIPQVNLFTCQLSFNCSQMSSYTHCRPINEKVNNAMRIGSVDPLIAGWPDHDAIFSVVPILPLRTLSSNLLLDSSAVRFSLTRRRETWLGVGTCRVTVNESERHETSRFELIKNLRIELTGRPHISIVASNLAK
jgi:hypothetical protein